jgi:hypothetical protein
MTDITVGQRLRSAVCDTEVIVLRVPEAPVELSCGGSPMTADSGPAGSPRPGAEGGTLLGKRYVDEKTGLEMLCTWRASGRRPRPDDQGAQGAACLRLRATP